MTNNSGTLYVGVTALIQGMNPHWKDLSETFEPVRETLRPPLADSG